MNSFDVDPILVLFSPKGLNLMTRKIAHALIFNATYTLIMDFCRLAELLMAPEQHNTSALAQIYRSLTSSATAKFHHPGSSKSRLLFMPLDAAMY